MWLQRTDAVKREKLRGHVDLYVVADGDVATDLDRLNALGDSRVNVGQNGEEGFRNSDRSGRQ